MPRELALLNWTEKNIVLNPNLDDFGVPAWVIHALRGAPGERPRTIKSGVLECQRCTEMHRQPSVHLRQHGDRLIVAHNRSGSTPCHLPESPEHQALKDRVASSAEGHGFQVAFEVSTPDRKARADVEVTGPSGVRIGHEIQLSALGNSALSRRNNTALRHGRVPSWLTTDQRAHAATRNLVDRVPWAMSNRLHPELVRKGRPVRVSAGLSKLSLVRCRDVPGLCPDNPQLLACSGFHTQWQNIEAPIEDFVGKTAAGLYLPVALPAQVRGVRRRWISPEDRELYVEATGLRLEEDAPGQAESTSRKGKGHSRDSRLHRPEDGPESTPRRRGPGRATAADVARGGMVVGTLHRRPDGTEGVSEAAARRGFSSREEEQWRDAALPKPCGYFLGQNLGVCASSPTRSYARGRRCYEHAPHSVAPAGATKTP